MPTPARAAGSSPRSLNLTLSAAAFAEARHLRVAGHTRPSLKSSADPGSDESHDASRAALRGGAVRPVLVGTTHQVPTTAFTPLSAS